MIQHKRVAVIIPARNEERSIGRVIGDLPAGIVDEVLVVDNASTDATAEIARQAGARVVREPRPGYGAACRTGLDSVAPQTDIVVILDADYSDYPEQIIRLLEPIAAGEADMVIGSRVLGCRQPGALAPQQYWGNKLAVWLIRLICGYRFTDMGPFRALRYESMRQLELVDRNYGWNVEMQLKAVQQGLRIREVPVDYRRRIGVSKISGTVSGTIKAGAKIIYAIFTYASIRRNRHERIFSDTKKT